MTKPCTFSTKQKLLQKVFKIFHLKLILKILLLTFKGAGFKGYPGVLGGYPIVGWMVYPEGALRYPILP